MTPKARPPIGSVNNQPIIEPPSFDEIYDQIARKHNANDARLVLCLFGSIAVVVSMAAIFG